MYIHISCIYPRLRGRAPAAAARLPRLRGPPAREGGEAGGPVHDYGVVNANSNDIAIVSISIRHTYYCYY